MYQPPAARNPLHRGFRREDPEAQLLRGCGRCDWQAL